MRLAAPSDMYEFTDALAEALQQVVDRFDTPGGRAFRVVSGGHPAPAASVWSALRSVEQIRRWHGWDDEGLEAEIRQIYFGEDVTEDPEAYTLQVQGGDRISVRPDGDGAKVTLVRAGLTGDPEWGAYYDDVTEGWITFVHQLRFMLERQPNAARRTLFFSGVADRTGPIATELGLAGIADEAAGTPISVGLLGEDVKGEVWFRSEHQLGITVDGWGGDGLLVVSYIPPLPSRPKGTAMAVLSTYGLDDARLTDLEQRWQDWWNPRYGGDAA